MEEYDYNSVMRPTKRTKFSEEGISPSKEEPFDSSPLRVRVLTNNTWKEGVEISRNKSTVQVRLSDNTQVQVSEEKCIRMEPFERIEWYSPPAGKGVPDHLKDDLDLVIVGYNPGMESARTGHHYAHRTQTLWPRLYEYKITKTNRRYTAKDDGEMMFTESIGFTNLCDRPTKSADELTKEEKEEGAKLLVQKLLRFKPRIICCNGMEVGLYFRNAIFPHNKISRSKFAAGLLDTRGSAFENTKVLVMFSTSGRCGNRPESRNHFMLLKQLVDELRSGTTTTTSKTS